MTVDPFPLVGRQEELASLVTLLDGLSTRRTGSLALLAGDAGMGKTHLAGALARQAESRGVAVAWGRAWEVGGAPAFWPMTEALRSLLREAPEAVPPPELALLLPELTAGGPPGPRELVPSTVGPADAARARLFDTVTGFLGTLTRARPALLILDDLHEADTPTLLLLEVLARSLPAMPVLLVGAYRPFEGVAHPEKQGLMARIGREGLQLALGPLSAAEIAALVSRHGVVAGPAAGDIARACGGNPLHAQALARLPAPDGDGPLPAGIGQAVRQHLLQVPAPVRAVLDTASVLGRSFALADLEVLAGVDRARAAVGEALGLGVLAGGDPLRASFSHVLVRDEIYGALAEDRRAVLHAAIAAHLAGLPSAPDRPAEIAHHFTVAGDLDQAVVWTRRAVESALEHLAFEEAVRRCDLLLPAVDGPGREEPRCQLLLLRALALMHSGDREAGRATARQAAELARRIGAAELLARAALAYAAGFYFPGGERTMVDLLRAAARALGPQPTPLRARVLARLSSALFPGPEIDESVRAGQEGLAIARGLGDARVLLDVLDLTKGGAFRALASPQERCARDEELLALALELGDRSALLVGRTALVQDYLSLADIEGADVQILALRREVEAHPYGDLYLVAPAIFAMRASVAGDFDEAHRWVEQARLRLATVQRPELGGALALVTFALIRARGDLDEIRASRGEMESRFGGTAREAELGLVIAAWFSMALGEPEQPARALGPPLPPGQHMWMIAADVAIGLRDRALALHLRESLAAYPWPVVMTGPTAFWGATSHVLAGLEAVCGEGGAAVKLYRTAIEIYQRLRAPVFLARARQELAALLAETGGGSVPGPPVLT